MSSHWNYRLIKFTAPNDLDSWVAIHEVHYTDNQPTGYSESPADVLWTVSEGGPEVGAKIIAKLKTALEKPILSEQDFHLPIGTEYSRRIGIAQGALEVPEDFDNCNKEISDLFEGGEAMAFAPVWREFGSPDYNRLIQEDFENTTGVFTPKPPHALADFDRLNVSELKGMTGPAMKSWMDRNHLNAKLAGIVEVCAGKYVAQHYSPDPEERPLAINVQTALRELGHDVSVAHAAAVWEYHSATLCAGWMLGAETVDGAIVALVSMAHFAS